MTYVDYLRGLKTDEQFVSRIRERVDSLFLTEGPDYIIGNLFHEELPYDRYNSFLLMDHLSLLPFVDIALQRGRFVRGLDSSGLVEGPKFLITKERGSYSSSSGRNPFVFSGYRQIESYYIYFALDAVSEVVSKKDVDSISLVSFGDDFLQSFNNEPNVFKDAYFLGGGVLPAGEYSKSNTGQVSLWIPLQNIDLRAFNPQYTIDGGPCSIEIEDPFLRVREQAEPERRQERRKFRVASSSGFRVDWKTYLIPKGSSKADLGSLPSGFLSGHFSDRLKESFEFPMGEGYPLLELDFDFEGYLKTLVPWIYGVHLSPFKDSDITTFNMLSVQNGDRSFERRVGFFDSFITPAEDDKWKGKICHFENFKTAVSELDLTINLNGQGNNFGGRAYFRNPRLVQVIKRSERFNWGC